MTQEKKSTYLDAGVDIEKGDSLVDKIKNLTKNLPKNGMLGAIGNFGGLVEISGHKNPILVSGTDGVGTKLKLASLLNKHDTIGIDLVAMCVNDVITSGAKPLYFLDYFATGKLSIETAENVIKGIVKGCEEAECPLIGGETAEMPGFYEKADYDLAGFSVGIVEKENLLDGSKININDLLIALPSSGVHSNGFSLVRNVLEEKDLIKYGDILLTPTKIYWKEIKPLLQKNIIHGISHITGGGIIGNASRMLPNNSNLSLLVNKKSIKINEIFKIIQKNGNIDEDEMYKVFNMGVGMVIAINSNDLDYVLSHIKGSYLIGKVITGKKEVVFEQ